MKSVLGFDTLLAREGTHCRRISAPKPVWGKEKKMLLWGVKQQPVKL
jgi:hypothetical protein